MNVSISTYNDADLLDGCLASVREILGNVGIQVVDGRYSTWPSEHDNSTDNTIRCCESYDAEYHPVGPFPREEDKHEYRVELAPDNERVLFLDADERLVDFDTKAIEPGVPYNARIHNPATYYETRELFYYPRCFKPEWLNQYEKTDLPEFRSPYWQRLKNRGRSDAISITHRHDLRGSGYRRRKLERYENENRSGPFANHVNHYLEGVEPSDKAYCPECGEKTLCRTRESNFGELQDVTRVATCINGDCYTAVEPVDVGDYRYLPDNIETGYGTDPERLRLELLDAGVELLTFYDAHDFHPEILAWMLDNDPTENEWPTVVG